MGVVALNALIILIAAAVLPEPRYLNDRHVHVAGPQNVRRRHHSHTGEDN